MRHKKYELSKLIYESNKVVRRAKMKKIDIHLHTQKCKKGDGASRVIDAEKFIEKIQENNVGLCAITNHNKFDINEYNAISSKPINFFIFRA
jgi:hypothetical protein